MDPRTHDSDMTIRFPQAQVGHTEGRGGGCRPLPATWQVCAPLADNMVFPRHRWGTPKGEEEDAVPFLLLGICVPPWPINIEMVFPRHRWGTPQGREGESLPFLLLGR